MGREETIVSDAIRAYLTTKGCIVYRMQSGRFRGAGGWITMNPEGTPDLVCGFPIGGLCVMIGVEIKTKIGKESEEQKEFGRKLEGIGGFYAVLNSEEQAKRFIAYVTRETMSRLQKFNVAQKESFQ